jgi:hypothetical protein
MALDGKVAVADEATVQQKKWPPQTAAISIGVMRWLTT